MTLTFSRLREQNVRRCNEVFFHIGTWTSKDWLIAVAGEVGEALNVVKKMRRGDAEVFL